jgi:hypothetical protein
MNLEKAVETAKHAKYANGQAVVGRPEGTEKVLFTAPPQASFQPLFSRISRISRFLPLPF